MNLLAKMKLLALFAVLLLALCSASNSHTHHTHSSPDNRPEESSSWSSDPWSSSPDNSSEANSAFPGSYSPDISTGPSSDAPQGRCDEMYLTTSQSVIYPGQSLDVYCNCISRSGMFPGHLCPQIEATSGQSPSHFSTVLKNTSCVQTASYHRIDSGSALDFNCSSGEEQRQAYVTLKRGSYEDHCQVQDDCHMPFRCSTMYYVCTCPDEKPIYIPKSENSCYSVAKLHERCFYSAQCVQSNRNSYCHLEKKVTNYEDRGECVCSRGYEPNDGKCEYIGTGVRYVWNFSRKYQAVFYALLALCLALILLGLVKMAMIHRRGLARRAGVVVSTRGSDAKPLTPVDSEKAKY